ncbi:MAG: hypothetical protein KGY81_02530 [Phycisphaerae bacterium]|jgi:hypothetical protein|nr:hypothetical protein [Phycisphaerae bacterium]
MLAVVLCAGPLLAVESETAKDGGWLAMAEAEDLMTGANEPVGMEPAGFHKPVWLPTIAIDYTMVSDYVFRGINFSEYPGEGREALNHQLGLNLEWGLGDVGRVGGGIWWEWYADQNDASSGFNTNQYGDIENNHIQEIDYYVYYGYTIEPLGLDAEIAFTWFAFPYVRHLAMGPGGGQVLSGDGATTQELSLNLSWDDSMLWKALGIACDGPILNTYLYTAFDLDLAPGGVYQEFGLSHEFAFGEWTQWAVIKDMSLTPSWAMAWQFGWLENYSLDRSAGDGDFDGIMNMNWGLNLTWMFSDTFNVPEEFGSMYLAGFMNYSHAIADHWLDDVFYGGMSVGWEW